MTVSFIEVNLCLNCKEAFDASTSRVSKGVWQTDRQNWCVSAGKIEDIGRMGRGSLWVWFDVNLFIGLFHDDIREKRVLHCRS